jgi:hypothetical protein
MEKIITRKVSAFERFTGWSIWQGNTLIASNIEAGRDMGEAVAKRIQSCWNAMLGIEDPEAFVGIMKTVTVDDMNAVKVAELKKQKETYEKLLLRVARAARFEKDFVGKVDITIKGDLLHEIRQALK